MNQVVSYYDAVLAVKDKAVVLPNQAAAHYRQLIKHGAAQQLPFVLPPIAGPVDLPALVDDGIGVADDEAPHARGTTDASATSAANLEMPSSDIDEEGIGAAMSDAEPQLELEPIRGMLDGLMCVAPAAPPAIASDPAPGEEGIAGEPEDAGIAAEPIPAPMTDAAFEFPAEIEGIPIRVEDFVGVRAGSFEPQAYLRLRVRCSNPAHRHCNLSRVVAPSTTGRFGKREPLAYVALWLSRRNAFPNRERHMAWKPSVAEVRQYVQDRLGGGPGVA